MSTTDGNATGILGAEVLRGPGPAESSPIHRHALGFYTAVCSVARFTRTSNTSNPLPIDRELVYTALHDVISRHSPLAVTIEGEDASARFIQVPFIDLERMVDVHHYPRGSDEASRQRYLNQVIEKRLSSRFTDLGVLPPWRIVALYPHVDELGGIESDIDIALFIHHAISDGVGATIFMRTLLAALNSTSALQRGEYPGKVVPPPKATFLPSLEVLRPLPVSYLVLLKIIWYMWFPASRAGLWTAKPVSSPSGTDPTSYSLPVVQTRHAIRIFSPETVARLLAACRAHQTTLTPLLEVLLARALFAVLPTDGTADRLKAACPINLRPFLPGDHRMTMGVYSSADDHEFRRDNTDVWEEAKRVGGSLARVLDDMKRGRHFEVGLLRYIRDMRAFFAGMVGKPRGDSFEVSNIGVVRGVLEEGPWCMSQILFTQSASVAGAAVKCSVSSVKSGPMTFSASWVEGVVEETVVDAVLEKFSSAVDDVCSGRL
ncbi:unnamed protein product [Peniophora sp. CBMAI 1063]|nr:unnamed protein product [Peniophora sp. CBMAI 1063]